MLYLHINIISFFFLYQLDVFSHCTVQWQEILLNQNNMWDCHRGKFHFEAFVFAFLISRFFCLASSASSFACSCLACSAWISPTRSRNCQKWNRIIALLLLHYQRQRYLSKYCFNKSEWIVLLIFKVECIGKIEIVFPTGAFLYFQLQCVLNIFKRVSYFESLIF